MNKTKLFLFVILGLILPVFFACAVDSGTVDPAYKYAWSNSAGWINFGCTNCNISVSGTKIIGYAWSENYGWISLNCENNNGTCTPNWGITNNGHGALSGSAWGTNTGWIDFSHVTINPQGQFTGTATGTVVGTVAFADCGAGCGVTITPFCGDGTCSNGETTDSCSNDCFSGSTGGECNRDSDCHQGTLVH